MATSQPSHGEEGHQTSSFQETFKKYDEIVPKLRKEKLWEIDHFLYQDFWIASWFFKGTMLIQDHFKSKAEDIILATYPKCGTTWFRALIFATINRNTYDFAKHPLLEKNPRDICPLLERHVDHFESISPIEGIPSPRFHSTHMPYTLFPKSDVTLSSTKFVYVCRDPKDCFVSMWRFIERLISKEIPLREAFEWFCDGVLIYGPYWDHVLSYWKASIEDPKRVLFMTYEGMKREPLDHVKRLGEFLGKAFSVEEEKEGVVDEIIRLCSFENLSNLEVNKSLSSKNPLVQNPYFFRKGQTGDWKNYLSEEMAARLDKIVEEKFKGSGLSFAS